MEVNPPPTGQQDGGTNNSGEQSCRSEFVVFSACIRLDWVLRLCPYLTPGKLLAHLYQRLPVHPHQAAARPRLGLARGSPRSCWADRTPWVLQAKTQHPFASCCSWISGWRVRSVFSATLIDGFIFQSIYLLNYPSVSKKSFLVNMVIGQSGWQQKHILVQFREKDDIPQFQFASGFPCQQSVN